jgi:hypothetical protein
MDQSVLYISASTPVPYASILVNMSVLLLEQCHAEDHIVVGNISNEKNNSMALHCADAIAHLYNLP